jgi:hypothetical protein
MFSSHAARHSPLWIRFGLSILAGACLITQIQCGGGSDGGTSSGPTGPTTTGDPKAIARENTLSGSSAWNIDKPSANGEIVAYANRETYPAGSDVGISVSANPSGQFSWKVFRMGSYGGLGGRLYAQGGPISAPLQPNPSFDATTGLVVCSWPTTFSFATRNADGSPWLTGVYVVLLTKQDGFQTYAIFILRDDTRHAEVAVNLATATWHAYNNFGGESLYVSSHGMPGGHAVKVSLDRPITVGFGAGKFLFEQHEGVRWLEDAGYDVEYFTSSDIGGAVNRLGNHRIYVSIGHDEYATMAVLDRLQALPGAGTSLAFLTGNTMVYQIRYEDNERTIVGYKDQFASDPMYTTNRRLTSSRFRDPDVVNRPENEVTGVMSDESDTKTPANWIVTNATHWVYANTGLTNGSVLPGLVFYEWDHFVSNAVTPSGVTILASEVVPNDVIPGSQHQATVFERGSAFVFAAGTVYFNQHLEDMPAVAQMTKNLLARAGATAYQP